ncbi:MAG TPA: FAD-binding protein, partial [Symbiobacteriaceae bacterium]|nr:FAD-binding protein [Symbiobacteriaceae bacterium]
MAQSLVEQMAQVTQASAEPKVAARYAVGDLTPAVVARPGSEAEVAAVLRAATAAGAVVVPFGAGTRQGIGHLPERADVVLSLERLNQMVDYVPADMT